MAHQDVWTCDRVGCQDRGGRPRPATFHLDLKVSEEIILQGQKDEHLAITRRRVDLCPACAGRLLDYLTDGLGYAQTQALVAFALGETPVQKEAV